MAKTAPLEVGTTEERIASGRQRLAAAAAAERQLAAVAELDAKLAWLVVVLPFAGFLAALALPLVGHPVTAVDLGCFAVMYLLSMAGIEIGYHRLFAHRSYKTTSPVQAVLIVLGSMAFQGPVIWWVATHRRHHDRTERDGDPHSPYLRSDRKTWSGFVFSHHGWLFDGASTRPPGWALYVSDLYREPLIFKLHMSYFQWLVVGMAVPAVADALLSHAWFGLVSGFLWGGLARVFWTNQFVWGLNSVAHLWGRRAFPDRFDKSRNNLWLVLPTLGQGWHNNHHAFPGSAVAGFERGQLDPGAWIIAGLRAARLAWDVKVPSRDVIAAKKRASTTAHFYEET